MEEIKTKIIPTELKDFAFFDYKFLDILANLAQQENWEPKNSEETKPYNHPILYSYIIYTFNRLANLYNEDNYSNYIIFKNNKALINIGLMTPNYERIFMLFKKNNIQNKQPFYCLGFFKESSTELNSFPVKPKKAKYISSLSDLLYDTNLPLIINIEHILSDEENKNRLPAELKNSPTLVIAFHGAIEILKKKLELNYKIAVPQFYTNRMQLLLPICLRNNNTPDIVLAVEKHGKSYTGHTCLTLDMAYNNARLIAKPEADWLIR